MSQFESQFGGEYQSDIDSMNSGTEPRGTSGMAVTALILAFTCVLSPLGVLLGLIALVARGKKRGLGLAIAAILVGLVLSVIAYGLVGMGVAGYKLMANAPRDALAAGFNGDIAEFQDRFYNGANTPAAEATAFLTTLESRYGAFTTAHWDQAGGQQPQQKGQGSMMVPYVLSFANGDVDAMVEIMFADPATGALAWKIGSITVEDADAGDLTYPPSGP